MCQSILYRWYHRATEGRDERDRASQIERIFTNSALPRDCCSGVSMSARGSSDSAVIDSRYKPAWQRECLSRSRRPCSPLSRSSALFAEDSSCSVLFVFIRGNSWFRIGDRQDSAVADRRYRAALCERVLKPRPAHPARQRRNSAAKAGGQEGLMRVARRAA